MRTVRLSEYEAKVESLEPTELTALLSTKLVDVRARADGLYELVAGGTVGAVAVPGLQVIVRPKVGLRNTFFLLGYAAGLADWPPERFPYEKDEFFPAIAWLLEAEVSRALRAGVVRAYQSRSEDLATVRGRINIDLQIKRRPGQDFPLACRFQEYTEDIELNRVVKAAVRRLLRIPALDRLLSMRLWHHLHAFTEVADVDYRPATVPELVFTRLNAAWERAGHLATLVLQADSLRDEVGSTEAVSFTVDMNKVFERFVECIVREEARHHRLELLPRRALRLTERITMRPDLILRRDRDDLAVGDAKYKRLDRRDPPHADLYQLLAYCVGLRLDRGLLIYGEAAEPRIERVLGTDIELEVVGIDLTDSPDHVLESARHAARRLVGQAETRGLGRLRAIAERPRSQSCGSGRVASRARAVG